MIKIIILIIQSAKNILNARLHLGMFLQAGLCWGLFAEVELEQAQADLELRF